MSTHWLYTHLGVAADPALVAELLASRAAALLRQALDLPAEAREPLVVEVYVDDGGSLRRERVALSLGAVARAGSWVRMALRWQPVSGTALPAFDGAVEFGADERGVGELAVFGSCAALGDEPVAGEAMQATYATARRLLRGVASEIGGVLPDVGTSPRRPAVLRVRDVMTPDPVTLREDTPILVAALALLRHQIGGVPVVDATGRAVGVLSESDLLLHEAVDAADPHEAARRRARTAGEACARPALTIAPDVPLRQAAGVLRDEDVSRLVVVEDERLVGVLSRHDVLKALSRTPAQLQHAVEDAIAATHVVGVSADVLAGGVVHVTGVASSDDAARVEAAVRAVDGVQEVVDELTRTEDWAPAT